MPLCQNAWQGRGRQRAPGTWNSSSQMGRNLKTIFSTGKVRSRVSGRRVPLALHCRGDCLFLVFLLLDWQISNVVTEGNETNAPTQNAKSYQFVCHFGAVECHKTTGTRGNAHLIQRQKEKFLFFQKGRTDQRVSFRLLPQVPFLKGQVHEVWSLGILGDWSFAGAIYKQQCGHPMIRSHKSTVIVVMRLLLC